jgi:prepilin-type N-terminal cleavage/methylation domain-containing protein
MKTRRPLPTQGFTLVEVMVSLGIFAFAILVIVGSLGTSGAYAANDARRTLTAELLHTCFRDLAFARTAASAPSPTLGLAPLVWGPAPTKVRLWFDVAGQRVDDEKQAFFKCDLTATREASGPLGHLHGRIVWPAQRQKGAPDGDVELFTSLLLP